MLSADSRAPSVAQDGPACMGMTIVAGCAALSLLHVGCESEFGGVATSGTTTTASSSTGIAKECELVEGMPIGSDCGIFVKANATGGDGSQAKPFGEMHSAVAAAGAGSRIYVCGSDTFQGALSISSGVSILGGLDCATWSFGATSAHPKIQSTPDVPALTIASGAATTKLASVDFDAVAATTKGTSSVAIFADGAALDLQRVALTAGNGAPGADGTDAPAQATAAPGGANGAVGCAMPPSGGPSSATNTCDDGASNGGKGGDGGLKPSSSGGNGNSGDMGTGAAAGLGEVNVGWTCSVGGVNGGTNPGNPGTDGPFGAGAGVTELGTLSATGLQNAAGHDATKGTKGVGGGGGGGSKATAVCNGAGGGSGGAGGCGGKLGLGGLGGGSTIGLLSKGSTVTLSEVTVSLGQGGAGGKGGNGQLGQGGGAKGTGGLGGTVNDACDGGKGGRGGHGGSAGGGRGGHAIALMYSGPAPTGMPSVAIAGTGGSGGPGGTNGSDQGGMGANGIVAPSQETQAQ